jgi:hypothetical protein
MSVFVSFGTLADDGELLDRLSGSGEKEDWTVNRNARPGDRLLFYLIAPAKYVHAVGTVMTKPKIRGSGPWKGHHCCDVIVDRVVSEPLRLSVLRKSLRAWGFTRRPTHGRIPEPIVKRLEEWCGNLDDVPVKG